MVMNIERNAVKNYFYLKVTWIAFRPYIWTWEVTELTCRGGIFHSLQWLDNRGVVRFLTRAAYLLVSSVSRTVWFPPILLLCGCWELFAWSWRVQCVKLATHFHAVLMLRKELYLHSPICLYVVVLHWSHDSFTLFVYRLLVIILFYGAQNISLNWVLHTNKCTNCISYITLKLYTLKHFHCSYMFR
jgi:hypothetical protein